MKAIYLAWASDLLPDEISIDDINISANKQHESYFIGNLPRWKYQRNEKIY
jgi:hypothetical protein